jgi:hypothetical protein
VARPPAEDPLVAQAFEAGKPGKPDNDELARAVEQLSPEEAAFFLDRLERALKKRKLQLLGYLVALCVWTIGMVCALAIYGLASGFVGWVFFVPFALVGLVLWIFGKWADKVGRAPPRGAAVAGEARAAPEPPAT